MKRKSLYAFGALVVVALLSAVALLSTAMRSFAEGEQVTVDAGRENNTAQSALVTATSPEGDSTGELLSDIRNDELREKDESRYVHSIRRLGEKRAVEAVDDLGRLLNYRRSLPSDHGGAVTSLQDPYPARSALFEIGKPSLPTLVKVIAENEVDSTMSRNATDTVGLIYREDMSEGVEFLRKAAMASQEPASERLLAASARLEEMVARIERARKMDSSQ